MLAVASPPGGAFAPNEAVVLHGTASCGRHVTVKAKNGAKEIATTLWRWPELGGERAGNYFLLRPAAGEWPAGAKLALGVSCDPKKLVAKIGAEKDVTPPAGGAVEAPKIVKGKTRYGKEEERLHVAFGTVADTGAAVCVRLRLVDPVARTSNVVEGAFRPGSGGIFSLAPAHPACVTAGFVIDAAGHSTPIPAAACAKGMDPTLAGSVGAWCGEAAAPAALDERWAD